MRITIRNHDLLHLLGMGCRLSSNGQPLKMIVGRGLVGWHGSQMVPLREADIMPINRYPIILHSQYCISMESGATYDVSVGPGDYLEVRQVFD